MRALVRSPPSGVPVSRVYVRRVTVKQRAVALVRSGDAKKRYYICATLCERFTTRYTARCTMTFRVDRTQVYPNTSDDEDGKENFVDDCSVE